MVGQESETEPMSAFRVQYRDEHVELLEGADAYQQEGVLTTFFRCPSDRPVVDSWSTRVASIRTDEIMSIWRLEGHAARDPVGA